MKQQHMAFVWGVLFAISIVGGISIARATDHTDLVPNTCQTRVGPARLTAGSRCWNNTVMTGTFNDYIYCAEIQVICQ